MTYFEWEKELLGYLKSLPESEKKRAVEYYREMYGDKIDAGMTNKEILVEFGEPKVCAARILMDSSVEDGTEDIKTAPVQKKATAKERTKVIIDKTKEKVNRYSAADIVGGIFLLLLLIIPICAAMAAIVVTFAAAAISGAVAVIGGIVFAVASPFGFALGHTGAGILANIGTGLVGAGAGALIAVVFFLLTKYSAIAFIKLVKYFYKRGSEK